MIFDIQTWLTYPQYVFAAKRDVSGSRLSKVRAQTSHIQTGALTNATECTSTVTFTGGNEVSGSRLPKGQIGQTHRERYTDMTENIAICI